MTLGDILLVGRTINATATATLSNGQNQPVTSGWQSSATHVATVTGTGTVRGVSNGTTAVSVSAGGQTASRTIRIAPDYDGRWNGLQTVTTCRDSGELTGACRDPELLALIGTSYPISVIARHAGALDVAGEFVAEGTMFPTFTTTVDDSGTIRFSSSAHEQELLMTVSWTMTSTTAGQASGSMQEAFTFPGLLEGAITVDFTFTASRTGASAADLPARQRAIRNAIWRRLR